MSTRRLLPLAGILALLGVGVWTAIQFLQTDSEDDSAVTTDARGDRQNSAEELDDYPDSGAQREVVEQPAPVEPADMPESYRDWLGTLTGRILEADETPAVDLPVAILELQATRWLVEPAALLGGGSVQPELYVASARTDEEGRFRLVGLEPRAVHLLGIDLGGPRAAPRIVDRSPLPGEVVDLGDIILDPYVTFLGRVIAEDGDPVEGARVRATDLPFAAIPHQFGLGDLRRGTSIFVELPEGLGGADFGSGGPVAPGRNRGESGRNRGESGRPGPGSPFGSDRRLLLDIPAVVWEFERLLPLPTTVTDEQGNYRLEGIPQGILSVFADKEDWQSAMLPSQPSGRRPERKIRDMVLRRGATVEGVVLDPEGFPIPGLEVRAGMVPTAMSGIPITALLMQPAGHTDVDGKFRLAGLPHGPEAFVALRRNAGQPWSKHGPFVDHARSITIELGSPAQLMVNLIGPDDKPIPEVTLYVSPQAMVPGLPPLLAPPMQRLHEVKRLEGDVMRVSGLQPGRYHLVGQAQDLALAEVDVEIEEGLAECTLTFEFGHFLDVEVRRAGDEIPLSWSFLTIAPRGAFEEPVDRARTNENGRARLVGMKTGPYTVTIQHPSRASKAVDVEIPQDKVVVLLEQGGHLKGRVHRDGEALGESLYVMAIPKGREDPMASPTFSATTPDGDFFLPNLEVGEYHYEIRDRIVGKGPMALFMTMRDDPMAEGEAEIFEGVTTEIDVDLGDSIDGPTATVSGEVWLNGRPGAELSVFFEGGIKRTAETDESGFFDLGVVPVGEGQLRVQKLGGSFLSMASSLHNEDLLLTAGENRYVNITLRTAKVSGRVSAVDSLLVGTGVMVSLRRKEGDSQQMQMANVLTGGFNFEDVTLGDYVLSVRKQGYADWREDLLVDGNISVSPELQKPASVAGFVVLPEGVSFPPPPAPRVEGEDRRRARPPYLTLRDDAGGNAGRARVDRETGAFTVRQGRPGRFRAELTIEGVKYGSEMFDVPAEGLEGLNLPVQSLEEEKVENPAQGDG